MEADSKTSGLGGGLLRDLLAEAAVREAAKGS